MIQEFVISGIILMGGSGCRFNDTTPKQFHKLSGKKIYMHTLDKFRSSRLFDELVLVCHPDWIPTVKRDISHIDDLNIHVVPGGDSRQASALIGIEASRGNYVVIHDAVRPFVSERILRENVEAAIAHKAVDTCIGSADTIVHTKDGESIANIPDRAQFLRGQTPQSFERELILDAHKKATDGGGSCECRLARDAGYPVHIVEGEESNLKITTMLDLYIAEQILRIKHATPQKQVAKKLAGKTFVVAGGTSGIGKALCEKLTLEGATAIPLGRSSEKHPVDLTAEPSLRAAFKQVHAHHGAVDGLINCVGLLKMGQADTFLPNDLAEMIATNFTSTVAACRECVIKPGGHIVNLSSSSYYRGRANYTIYSSMKAAIVNFTQGYADEHPDLRVNVVIPQRTSTPMRWNNFPGEDPSTLLCPYTVAETIINLLKSDDVTGTIFEVKKSKKAIPAV